MPRIIHKAGRFAGKIAIKAAKRSVASRWKTGKKVFNTVNPINKPVNWNDVSDHGVESLRMVNAAHKTGKRTIQTTKTTIKTTQKTIQLAGDAAKTTYKATKYTVIAVYKVTKVVVFLTKKAVIGLVTLASFPLFWIIVAVLAIIVILISGVAALFSGASTIEEQNREAATDPIGLADDIPQDILDAVDFFRIACQTQKEDYCGMINGYYYDIDNLRESDLVYEVRNNPPTTYETSFATPARKAVLCNAWDVAMTEPEALAIVYVLLERAENNANGTVMELYPVEYTQAAFDDLLDVCCVHTDTVYSGQECPSANCVIHYHEEPNPDYTQAENAYTEAVNRRDDFNTMVAPWSAEYRYRLEEYNAANAQARSAMEDWVNDAYRELVIAFQNWETVFGYTGWEVNENMDINCSEWLEQFVIEARQYMESLDEVIRTPYYTCDHVHNLHSVGLNIFNAEETMIAYGFSDAERQWAENLIITYSAYFYYLAEGGA